MTHYLGEFSFHVSGCETEDAFDRHLDTVLDELYSDARVIDPDYTASLALRNVEFAISVDCDGSDADAFAMLHSALRAAIHGAGGGTPGWEEHFKAVQSSVRAEALVDA